MEFQKGDRVIYKFRSDKFPEHSTLADEFLFRNKIYTVEHFFTGDVAQIELKEVDNMLFLIDLFELVV